MVHAAYKNADQVAKKQKKKVGRDEKKEGQRNNRKFFFPTETRPITKIPDKLDYKAK